MPIVQRAQPLSSYATEETLAVMRSQYAGSIIFNAGFLYYLYLSITSLRQLARLPHTSPARRTLFPYTLGLLVINTGFAISQNIVIEAVTIEGPWGTWLPDEGCNPNLVFRTIFLALPIFMNDLLFLYRAAVLVQWRMRIMALPLMIYLTSFALAVHGLVLFRSGGRCRSAEGLPFDLMIPVILTACLNAILGGIIIWKLYYAQYASKVIGAAASENVATRTQQRRYTRIAAFISESALLWIVTAVLQVATAASPSATSVAPFFELLFEIAVMLSPVMLTHRISLENAATRSAAGEQSNFTSNVSSDSAAKAETSA